MSPDWKTRPLAAPVATGAGADLVGTTPPAPVVLMAVGLPPPVGTTTTVVELLWCQLGTVAVWFLPGQAPGQLETPGAHWVTVRVMVMVEVWVEVVVTSTSPSGLVAETRDRPAAMKVKMALNCIVAVLMGCGCGEVDQKGGSVRSEEARWARGFRVKATRSTTMPAFEGEKGDKKESFVLGLVMC